MSLYHQTDAAFILGCAAWLVDDPEKLVDIFTVSGLAVCLFPVGTPQIFGHSWRYLGEWGYSVVHGMGQSSDSGSYDP